MQVTTTPHTPTRRTHAEALAERLYATHYPRLLAIARRNCADAHEAEEALHDAFVFFIEHFDADQEAPALPWLTLTLKRRCWALYKRRRRRPDRPDPEIASRVAASSINTGSRSTEDAVEVAEEIARWAERLSALKRDERRALGLLALGYSYGEICEITGWSYTKVNRCLVEGRAKVRRSGAQR